MSVLGQNELELFCLKLLCSCLFEWLLLYAHNNAMITNNVSKAWAWLSLWRGFILWQHPHPSPINEIFFVIDVLCLCVCVKVKWRLNIKGESFFCWFGLFFFFSVCSTKKLEAVATKRHKQALMLCASCLKLYCLFTALVLHLEQDRLKKWQLFCSMCVLALKDVYGESIFLAIKNFQEIKYLLVQVSLPYLVVIVLFNNPRF